MGKYAVINKGWHITEETSVTWEQSSCRNVKQDNMKLRLLYG